MANFQVFVFCVLVVAVTLNLFEVNGQYYGRYVPCPKSYMDPDGDCLAGIGGKDYPMLASIPKTSFKCNEHPVKYVGYFADVQTQCQVFHVCTSDGRTDTFLCPNGTLFNQQFLVCDWWFNVKCQEAYKLYSINDYLQSPTYYRRGPLNPKEAPISHAETPIVTSTDSPHDSGPNLWSTLLSAASSSILSSALSSGSRPSKGSVSSIPFSASGSSSAANTNNPSDAGSWSVPVSASMSYPGSSMDKKDPSTTDGPSTGKLLTDIFSFLKSPKKPNAIPTEPAANNSPILPRSKPETQQIVAAEDRSDEKGLSNNKNEQTVSQSSVSSDIVGKPRQF